MPNLSEIDQKTPEFMKAIHDFVANPRGFLLIAGTNGNGKSFSSRAIFDHFYHVHTENKWWNQAALNMKWQEFYSEFGSTKYLADQIILSPLLVLDDIGTRKPSDAFMDFLYWIVDQRYEHKNKCGTIITTNLTTGTMGNMFGDAFVSRVSSGICVRNDEPDRRAHKF